MKDGRVKLLTPRDPTTGLDHRLFDPLDWIHAITTQIPDPRQHLTRYQGAYANTARARYRPKVGEPNADDSAAEDSAAEESAAEDTSTGVTTGARGKEDEASTFDVHRRRSWARLLRRIYEVDPLLCPCGGELKIISILTDPVVVDRILSHRRKRGSRAPSPPGHRRPREGGTREDGLNRRAKCSRRGRRVHCPKTAARSCTWTAAGGPLSVVGKLVVTPIAIGEALVGERERSPYLPGVASFPYPSFRRNAGARLTWAWSVVTLFLR